MSEELDINEYVLYGPRTGKQLKRLYPELDEDEDFKVVKNDDLLFAWYMGIPGSPVDIEWPHNTRLKVSADRSFSTNTTKKKEYVAGNIPDDVKKAIKKFEEMSPEARLMAKKAEQKAYANLCKLIDIDVDKAFIITKKGKDPDTGDTVEINVMDWSGRKQYADSVISITKAFPEMLRRIETGYGMSEKSKKTASEANGTRSIDLYHKNKQQKPT